MLDIIVTQKTCKSVVVIMSVHKRSEVQVCYIILLQLWENGKVLCNCLIGIVKEYSNEEVKVIITYEDKDGGLIAILTDNELADVFGQL
eukprot:14200981-Ditylum_brightwellii.AAC.1